MQRESVPAGNKAVVTKALGQTVSPHNHTFSSFPRRYTQHSQDALRHQGNEWGVIMRASRITSQQTLGTARTPKQFATSHAHGGVSQPEGGTMRRYGGEEEGESHSIPTPTASHSPLFCATTPAAASTPLLLLLFHSSSRGRRGGDGDTTR
jgi:hypothetical protein